MKTHRSCPWFLPGLTLLASAGLAFQIAAQNGVPTPDHIVIVIEENHSFGDIIKSSGPSYINALARQGALFVDSYAISHPSEPNYLALFSGSTHGVHSDICSGAYGAPNLASELLGGGRTFVGYSESLPHVGFTGCESGHYKRKHNPWVNFTNVPPQLNQPLTLFPTNLSELPTLSFVIPNQANDMHSGSVGQADAWLRRHLDGYVQWARTNNSLLIVTWDEDDKSENNRIATIFVGPMVRPGKYCERITHYNVLRTLLEMYSLAPMVHATNADPITSCWMPGTAPSAITLELASPANGDVFLYRSNVLIAGTAVSSNALIRRVEFFDGARKLGETTNSPFQFAWSNAAAGAHCVLARATDDAGRTKTTESLAVRVLPPDTTPPAVTIVSPAPGIRVLTPIVLLDATGADNVGIASMAFRVGEAPFQFVQRTNHLVVSVDLSPGTNSLQVKAIDYYGHESAVASVRIFLVTTSSLTVSITGNGSVNPDLDGHALEVGRSYTMLAKPAPGNLFAGWSGGVTSQPARLVFLMQSNLVLQAKFVTNPFIAVRGVFAGLFYEPDEVRHETSGYFSMALTDQGKFSAHFLSAGRRFSYSGAFNLSGQATNVLKRPGTNALVIELMMDLDHGTQTLTGLVSTVSWQAALAADRDGFDARAHPAPFATNYTLVVRGDPVSALRPGGDGFGSSRVSAAGAVSLSCGLADGSKLTQGTTVSTNGFWPFYAPLYGGKGSILSWITFADRPSNDLGGTVSWIKPPSPSARLYPAGFTFLAGLEGSIYTRPTSGQALTQTNGTVVFTGGGLAMPFTNEVTLGSDDKIINESSNALSITIGERLGLFHGSVTPPGATTRIPFLGALLQKQNSGSGFFLETNLSGRVSWEKID